MHCVECSKVPNSDRDSNTAQSNFLWSSGKVSNGISTELYRLGERLGISRSCSDIHCFNLAESVEMQLCSFLTLDLQIIKLRFIMISPFLAVLGKLRNRTIVINEVINFVKS